MPRLTFVSPDGSSRTLQADSGFTVMENALRNSVKGIDADCNGLCACATCHVYVDPSSIDMLKSPEPLETDMLSFACDVEETSRLSCQITVTEELDGLIVHVPKRQR